MQHEAATKDTLIIGKDGSFLLSKMQGCSLSDGVLEVNAGGLISKITPIAFGELARHVKAKDKMYGLGIGTPAIHPDMQYHYSPLPERTAYLLADKAGNVEVCGECGFIFKLAGNGVTRATEVYIREVKEAERQWDEKRRLLALEQSENRRRSLFDRLGINKFKPAAFAVVVLCVLSLFFVFFYGSLKAGGLSGAEVLADSENVVVADATTEAARVSGLTSHLVDNGGNGLVPLPAPVAADAEFVSDVAADEAAEQETDNREDVRPDDYKYGDNLFHVLIVCVVLFFAGFFMTIR